MKEGKCDATVKLHLSLFFIYKCSKPIYIFGFVYCNQVPREIGWAGVGGEAGDEGGVTQHTEYTSCP